MPKVKFNICNAHVAVKNTDENGKVNYDAPIAVPGSVSLALEAKGDISTFYADGIVYYKSSVNSGYEGDWEVAIVPDEIREKILKEVIDKNKVMLEQLDVALTEFAFGFQIDGDTKSTRFWFYNCCASRTKTEGKTTEDKKDPQTEVIPLTASSEKVIDGSDVQIVRAKTTDEVSNDVYANWFKNVYIPELEAAVQAEQS